MTHVQPILDRAGNKLRAEIHNAEAQARALADPNARYWNFYLHNGDVICEQRGAKNLAEAIEDIREFTHIAYLHSHVKWVGGLHHIDLSEAVREAELDAAAERKFQEDTRRDYLARVL